MENSSDASIICVRNNSFDALELNKTVNVEDLNWHITKISDWRSQGGLFLNFCLLINLYIEVNTLMSQCSIAVTKSMITNKTTLEKITCQNQRKENMTVI